MPRTLEFRHLSKAFGAVQALDHVSFSIRAGDAHGVVGENGAGKSTLLKILAGIVRPDGGELAWEGERLDLGHPREALERGIGMVYQEMLAFPTLSVAANVFAGRELTRAGGLLDDRAMDERTCALLERLQVPVAPDTPMDRLPAAYAQLVQVARALAFDCRVLVLDEPTTSLTDAEVDRLFAVLTDLRSRGVTVIFVSHRIPEVFRLCDRITVLRDGRHVDTFDRDAVTPDDVIRAMVGREPPPRLDRGEGTGGSRSVLSLRGLSRPPAFEDVTIEVGAGEVVGLFGLVGSGRTELLEAVFGVTRPTSGTVAIDGETVAIDSPRQGARAGLAFVPEERHRQGLFFNLSIRDNIALPRAATSGDRLVDRSAEERLAGEQVRALNIRTPDVDRTPDQLSGGNQQKVVTAKWLATGPKVLLLDEPTKGVDVGAKFEIHRLIRRQAEAGTACLVVSSELPEMLALADRIVVMREGRIRGEVAGATATEEQVMRLAAHEAEARP